MTESALYRFLDCDTPSYALSDYGAHGHRISRHGAPSVLDLGNLRYQVENVYLGDLDGDAELDVVARHLATNSFEPGDRLRLALALNMVLQKRSQIFERVLDLVHRVPDQKETDLIASVVMAFAASTLTKRQRKRLRKELKMGSQVAEELYQDGVADRAPGAEKRQ